MSPHSPPTARHAIRVRILSGSTIAIGPGKAELLQAIAESGSISAAARRMRMSYRRAWLLVRTMNECFAKPLVEAAKGGRAGGGALLTTTGAEVLALYHETSHIAAARFAPYLLPGADRRRTSSARRRPTR